MRVRYRPFSLFIPILLIYQEVNAFWGEVNIYNACGLRTHAIFFRFVTTVAIGAMTLRFVLRCSYDCLLISCGWSERGDGRRCDKGREEGKDGR